MPQDNRRLARVGHSIQQVIASYLTTRVDDPALAWVSITDVEVSQDTRSAKVFFSLLDCDEGRKKRSERALTKVQPLLQRAVASSLRLRNTPVLRFVYDDTAERAARVSDLVSETAAERREREREESPEARLARWILDAERIAITGHAKPDADAVGSALALRRILVRQGKDPVVWLPDGLDPTLAFLPGADAVVTEVDDGKFDLVIAVDCASSGQLPSGTPTASGKLVVLDHHAVHEASFGDLVIRHLVSSTGELLWKLSKELLWPLDADAATCLMAAVITDTGSFRYENTTAQTFTCAAELAALGARPHEISEQLFDNVPASRQRLLAQVARTLEFHCGGAVATVECTQDMLDGAGATLADLDGMVNVGRVVRGVRVAALLYERDGGVKVSLRSQAPIDVAAIAARFGGGGHVRAAGAYFPDRSIAASKAVILDALCAAVRDLEE